MFNIAGDAFFLGLLFKMFSGEHNHPPYSEGVNELHPYSSHHRVAARKYQTTKSHAFETNYYGHRDDYSYIFYCCYCH